MSAIRGLLWILRDREPVPMDDVHEWAAWFDKRENCRVACDVISLAEHDDMLVSTVFLGIAQSPDRQPLLFESRVFGGPLDTETWRYRTLDDAEAGHLKLMERVALAGEIRTLVLREKLKAASKGE